VDPTILVAIALLAVPAILVLAVLSLIGTVAAGFAAGALTGGQLHRPS
jgi:hypothetical protein